jgi:hypothetical protein
MEQTMRPRFFCLALVTILLFPVAFAQWVQTNGTSADDSRRSAVNGGNIFAGTDSRGVFLSTNNGSSWIAAKSGLTDSCVGAFAVSGSKPFAGTVERGVFFSTDDGTTWTAANTGAENSSVQNLAAVGSNLFAGRRDSAIRWPGFIVGNEFPSSGGWKLHAGPISGRREVMAWSEQDSAVGDEMGALQA